MNVVLTRSTNLSELISFVELTKSRPISVRFIEFMPFSGNDWDKQQMVSYDEALSVLKKRYQTDLEMVRDEGGDGTSKRWKIKGYQGEIGFISSMSDHFCGTCNRLRITADGNLKVGARQFPSLSHTHTRDADMALYLYNHLQVCLFDNTEVSLRDVLRSPSEPWSSKNQDLVDVISMAVGNKKPKHAGMDLLQSMQNRSMVMIGG